MRGGGHPDRGSYQGSCCPGGLCPTLLGAGGYKVQGELWWSPSGSRWRKASYDGLERGNKKRSLLEALQQGTSGPHGTDLQGLPEHQQQTDSTMEKEEPWSLVACGNRASLAPFSLYAPTRNSYKVLAADEANGQDSRQEITPVVRIKKSCKRIW